MPKRKDLQSVLIIGAGPIVIGQACEFDYSGAQACKALREEGYRVILVNSNPATIMTDPELADATYIEPITTDILELIIEQERPDALLPTLGGQTGLNAAVEVARIEAGVGRPEILDVSLEGNMFSTYQPSWMIFSSLSTISYNPSFVDMRIRLPTGIRSLAFFSKLPSLVNSWLID